MYACLNLPFPCSPSRQQVLQAERELFNVRPPPRKPTYQFIDDQADCSDVDSESQQDDDDGDVSGLIDDEYVW